MLTIRTDEAVSDHSFSFLLPFPFIIVIEIVRSSFSSSNSFFFLYFLSSFSSTFFTLVSVGFHGIAIFSVALFSKTTRMKEREERGGEKGRS